MSGHKNFDELKKKMDADPEHRKQVEIYKQQLTCLEEGYAWLRGQGCSEEEAMRGMGPMLSFLAGTEEEDIAEGKDVPRISLLFDEWMRDESGYDEETWPELREYLERMGKM